MSSEGVRRVDPVNPHGLCTWGDGSECEGCELRGRLNCRWERQTLIKFLAIIAPFVAIGVPGMYLAGLITGSWGPQLLYAAFVVVFFTILETRVLCRHCPFYSRGGSMLRCYANHGLPKLWSYQPRPASLSERATLLLSFIVMAGAPILIELNGLAVLHGPLQRRAYAGLTFASALAVLGFFTFLGLYFCPRCVNFSCPFNRTPRELRRRYLEKNPVMGSAWSSLD
jgi:hypothetical protein